MVKNIILIVAILLLAITGYQLLHRHPPSPPPPGPGMNPPGDHTEKLKDRRGTVLGYRYNAHLDVNAIEIKTVADGNISIDFRPHTAKKVMAIAPVGDSVLISTGSKPNDEYVVYQLHQVQNLRTHEKADLDALPPPPDVPPNALTENFTLHAPQLLTDPYGGIDAITQGNLLFHFKPGLVDEIAGLIKSAPTITLSAVQRSDNFGFVNIHHDKVYIVLTVTIDQKTFIVR